MIDHRLAELFRDVLDLEPNFWPEVFSRETVENWDSLAHLRLITAVEREYGVSLTMDEAVSIDSFDGMQRVLEQRSN